MGVKKNKNESYTKAHLYQHDSVKMYRIHHYGHSSVMETLHGFIECRRGTLREFAIPNPYYWSTREDWMADYPLIHFDILRRPIPRHFTKDQAWMLQWVEESTLEPLPDETGLVYMQPSKASNILLYDIITNRLLPLYMNVRYGTFWVEGRTYTAFGQMPYQIAEIWRMEAGSYYRIR